MRIVLSALLFAPSLALAYDGAISMDGCPSVSIRVDDIATASGWGAHFSTGIENGYGGSAVECHLTPDGSDNIMVLCYDGYNASPAFYQNQFEFNIGDRDEIDFVTFSVGKRGVQVTAQLLANNAYNVTDIIPYSVTSFFPLREATGFCRASASTMYYVADGVLSGTSSRTGSGYTLSVTYP